MESQEIRHKCLFCKVGEVVLSLDKIDHTCECGVIYGYRINKGHNKCKHKPHKKNKAKD